MERLYCKKCGREHDFSKMLVCYRCGNYVCEDCSKSGLCPKCLDKLSHIM